MSYYVMLPYVEVICIKVITVTYTRLHTSTATITTIATTDFTIKAGCRSAELKLIHVILVPFAD